MISNGFSESVPVVSSPIPVEYGEIYVGSELRERMELLYQRLQEEHWLPNNVFMDKSYQAPGDMEGRTILALTLLSQCLGKESPNLASIIKNLDSYLNSKGYFGEILPDGLYDELQLSSHGWYGRGICDYYKWKRDEFTKEKVEALLEGLILKMCGKWKSYPLDSKVEDIEGAFIGIRSTKPIRNWYLSTDTSCGFLFGEAVMSLYMLTSEKMLLDIAIDMAEIFMKIDHKNKMSQVHSTLTALKWILKLYEYCGEIKYLSYVENMFSETVHTAITANFETYNWYQRPEWTEGCGVVDLFQLSLNLWRLTQDSSYLDMAEMVYYNGLNHVQRPNGGIGLDNCPKEDEYELKSAGIEAYWCCTMRGGEGYATAVQFSYLSQENVIWVPLYSTNRATVKTSNGVLDILQETLYPQRGNISFRIFNSTCPDEISLRFRIPNWVKGYSISLNGREMDVPVKQGFVELKKVWNFADTIVLNLEYSPRVDHAYRRINLEGDSPEIKGFSIFYGPLQLSINKNTTGYSSMEKLLIEKDSFKNHIKLQRPVRHTNYKNKFELPLTHFLVKANDSQKEYLLTPICEYTGYAMEYAMEDVMNILFDGIVKD